MYKRQLLLLQLPVHCAAAGGNLYILAWLVEDQCCPLFFDSAKTVRRMHKCIHDRLSVDATRTTF